MANHFFCVFSELCIIIFVTQIHKQKGSIKSIGKKFLYSFM